MCREVLDWTKVEKTERNEEGVTSQEVKKFYRLGEDGGLEP